MYQNSLTDKLTDFVGLKVPDKVPFELFCRFGGICLKVLSDRALFFKELFDPVLAEFELVMGYSRFNRFCGIELADCYERNVTCFSAGTFGSR